MPPPSSIPDATCLHLMFLELKSIVNPLGKDFMDFWLISVVLPREALWTRRPMNPLIELSLPEENTINRVSSWLQNMVKDSLRGPFTDSPSATGEVIPRHAFLYSSPTSLYGTHWYHTESLKQAVWRKKYSNKRIALMIQHWVQHVYFMVVQLSII